MIAVYCNYTYDEICNLPYHFYQDIISEIILKLRYQSIANLTGRDYVDTSVFEYISDNNPGFIDQFEKNIQKKKPKHEKVTLNKFKELGLKVIKCENNNLLK